MFMEVDAVREVVVEVQAEIKIAEGQEMGRGRKQVQVEQNVNIEWVFWITVFCLPRKK